MINLYAYFYVHIIFRKKSFRTRRIVSQRTFFVKRRKNDLSNTSEKIPTMENHGSKITLFVNKFKKLRRGKNIYINL